ncbi:MAG TPA: hypothetical protein P5342_02035, partial [Candidatus Cloacimonadota bacterium]|nr:hypothetical protein [Candidatus Cloacimonadota bacterium]
MKRIAYHLFALSLLLSLGSCFYTSEPYNPRPEPWLCSVNADGTGFRRIKKVDMSFGTTGFWDIYMTKDDRIIFYGEKLWISETDTIRPVSITDNIYTLQQNPARLSQSPDGSKLYFASRDKNIHELDLNTMLSRQLTSESIRTLRNPIVSDLGNYITYSSRGYGEPSKFTEYMYWLNLKTGESDIIPSPDTIAVNPSYSEIENYVYYEKVGLFRSKLDGSDRSNVDNQGGSAYPYSMFSISKDRRYIVHIANPSSTYFIRIFDRDSESGIDLPVKEDGASEYMGVLCKDVNRIFYVSPGYPEKLHVYNPDTGEDTVILQSTVVSQRLV